MNPCDASTSPQPIVNAHTHLELTDLGHLCPTEPVALSRWLGRVSRPLHRLPLLACLATAWLTGRWRPLGRALGCTYPFSKSGTPVAWLHRMGALQCRPLLIHLVHVNDDDIALIRQSGATAVHCPRSNALLGCGRMPLEKFLAAGVPVLLGTDSLASAPSLDVRDEVTAAQQLHEGVVDPKTIAQMAHAVGDFTSLPGA